MSIANVAMAAVSSPPGSPFAAGRIVRVKGDFPSGSVLSRGEIFAGRRYINDLFRTGICQGVEAIEKTSAKAVFSIGNEYALSCRMYAAAPSVVPRPLAWRVSADGRTASVVTERVKGPSLSEIMQRGMTEIEADSFAADFLVLADALEKTRIVHRDLFADNFILGPDGHLKTIDWQLAVDRDDFREDPWVRRHWKFRYVVFGVNRDMGLGHWNDFAALANLLAQFPQTMGVKAAAESLLSRAGKMTVSDPPDFATRLKLRFYAVSLRIQMLIKGRHHRKYVQLERRLATIRDCKRGSSPLISSVVALAAVISFALSGNAAPRARTGRLERVKETPALKVELDRYGLTAGRFVRSDPLPVEGGRNVPQELKYLLFSPRKCRLAKVPIVVYLPGTGEIGESLEKQFHEPAVFKVVASEPFQKQRPCYLLAIAPPPSARTLLDGLPGNPSPVQMLVTDAIKEISFSRKSPSVDVNRVYLTGLSYGGGGVYGLMTSYPDMFAAGVPVASFPPPPSFVSSPLQIWHIYNDGDYSRLGLNRGMLEPFATAVENCGGTFRLGTFPSAGHNAWVAAWSEESVWDWTFAQSLQKSATGRRKSASPGQSGNFVEALAKSDIPAAEGHEAFRAADGFDGTWFESAGPARKGDSLTVDFSSPVKKRVSISRHIVKGETQFPMLLVEVSKNGKSWTRACAIPSTASGRTFMPASQIRHVRITVSGDANVPLRISEVGIAGK